MTLDEFILALTKTRNESSYELSPSTIGKLTVKVKCPIANENCRLESDSVEVSITDTIEIIVNGVVGA